MVIYRLKKKNLFHFNRWVFKRNLPFYFTRELRNDDIYHIKRKTSLTSGRIDLSLIKFEL